MLLFFDEVIFLDEDVPRPSRPDADAVIIVAGLTGDDPKAGD